MIGNLFLIDECQSAFAAVSAILVGGHENSGSAGFSGTFASQTVNFSVLIDLLGNKI